MIYLIDDNQSNQRIEKYNIHYVDNGELSDILTSINKIDKNADLSFLQGAACILLHATTEDVVDGEFVKGAISNVTKIKEILSKEGTSIPLAMFSYGMNEAADFPNSNYLRAISKPIFYGRLSDFLLHYREKGEVELNILAYGKNFASVKVSEYVHLLVNDLLLRDPNDILKLSDIKVHALTTLIQMSSVQIKFLELMESLEDKPITVGKYLENLSLINQSFAEHGKNIYGWL